MGQKEKAAKLLRRYLSGKTTIAENKQVDHWYDSYSQNQAKIDAAKKKVLQKEMFGHIEARIWTDAVDRSTKYRILKPFIGIAASVIFIVFAVVLWQHSPQQITANNTYSNISSDAHQQKRILLDDGTEVILQPGSTIQYQPGMRSGKRMVNLISGEAFFKIAHDAKRPFRIKMPEGLYTQVLGTSFTIKAYPGMAAINVMVNTGRVAVGKGNHIYSYLVKGQSLIYDKVKQTVSVHKPIPSIGQPFQFDRMPLAALATRLEKTYDIAIELPTDPRIGRLKCTGSFDSNQDIREVLQTVCLLHGLKLHYQSDQQIFKITKP